MVSEVEVARMLVADVVVVMKVAPLARDVGDVALAKGGIVNIMIKRAITEGRLRRTRER